ETLKVTIELNEEKGATPIAPPPQATDAVAPPPPLPSSSASAPLPIAPKPRAIPWAGWATTAVFATGAVATGLVALAAKGDLQTKLASSGETRADLDKAKSRATVFGVISDVCTGGALIAGSVSLYLTITSDKRIEARLVPGGMTFRGSF